MARTAPAVDGSGNVKMISIRMIDVSGDKRAVSFELGLASTDAEIEAFIAAYAAVTNALVYAVWVSQVYNSQLRCNAPEENCLRGQVQQRAQNNLCPLSFELVLLTILCLTNNVLPYNLRMAKID